MSSIVKSFSRKRVMGLFSGLVFAFMALSSGYITSTAHAEEEIVTHIYIDQASGVNSSSTSGSEAEPFKSITYAMYVMKNQEAPDPWVVHIKAGIYDSDSIKPANEREVFPIELRNKMTIQGDDGVENCIISGEFNAGSQFSILRGVDVLNITIKNLTLRDMNKTSGGGGGCYLNNSSGSIEGCVFQNNKASYGGGIYVSVLDGERFDITNNTFSGNSASSSPYGGGFCVDGNLNGNITGNTFTDNSGSGFRVNGGLSGNITDNIFSGNSASSGGGFYVYGGLIGNITDNTFSGNSTSSGGGGGFYVYGGLSGNITDNTFSGNSASSYGSSFGGGFYVYGGLSGNITDNTFSGNSSNSGGGFRVSDNLTGNITENTFSGNSAFSGSSFRSGGGFCVDGDLTGNIAENTFSGNSGSSGGGFCVADNLTGNITENTFSGNSGSSGGGFDINGFLTGSIDLNLFSNNSASNYGGGFYLGNSGGDSAAIFNNFFLYNSISGNSKLRGAGFYSKQNAAVVNNTFYYGKTGESCVNISNSGHLSVFKNNIFAGIHTAIWEEGELELTIKHNNFHDVTDILHRNNQPMGNDFSFIEMLLPDFSDNIDSPPGFVGEDADTGAWTQDPVYDAVNNHTILTDSNKSWEYNQWKGAMAALPVSLVIRKHYPIIANTATQIMVMGNLTVTTLGAKDQEYSIDDYHLAEGSGNIDVASETGINRDFDGDYRPQGAGIDIGADEFFTGDLIPSIAVANPCATDIAITVATLNARVNSNGLNATCYFEYGTTTAYGSSTEKIDVGSDSGLSLISQSISGLTDNTLYHFRLVATNDTGTVTGPDQIFTTLRVTAIITGRISLSIAGLNDLSIPNATVTLDGTGYSATTDVNGNFIIEDVPAGNYTLTVAAQDLLATATPITLNQSQTLSLGPVHMQVEGGGGGDCSVAVLNERSRWDVNGDNKKGIEEAIDALQVVSNMK